MKTNFKCKICKSPLPLKYSSNNVYWCRNNEYAQGGHYYLIAKGDCILAEAWIVDFPERKKIIRQNYDASYAKTFIFREFGLNNAKSLDYFLFDFDHFDENQWLEKIEMLAFYE